MKRDTRRTLTTLALCTAIAAAASVAAAGTVRYSRPENRTERRFLQAFGMRGVPSGCAVIILDPEKPATDPFNLGLDCETLPLVLGSWGS